MTQEDIMAGAVLPICFCLGGIWAWLRFIHLRLCEIRTILIVQGARDALPVVKDRTR